MEKIDWKSLSSPVARAARTVAERLREQGYEALFAGGCVRDALLGRPFHDIDIATSATPGQIEALFRGRTIAVGRAFGIIVVLEGGFQFDVATFRRDGNYLDGRHPEGIALATREEDASRRDFTVNGLFSDPADGRVIDGVGGIRDLEGRRIRAIGRPEERFREDHLRMLRAIRFASVLDFKLDPSTFEAIRNHPEWIRTVSPERISAEFTRLICESPRPSLGLDLLRISRLLDPFLPEVAALYGVRQPPQFHPEGDVWTHTCLMLDGIPAPRPPELAWSLLLHDVGKPPTFSEEDDPKHGGKRIRFMNHAPVGARMAEKILRRLKMSNALISTVCPVVENHMRFIKPEEMREAKLRRFMGAPYFPVLLQVMHQDLQHSNGDLSPWILLSTRFNAFRSEPILPPPLVKGRDLLAWGVPPGPAMGEMLTRLYDAQLEEAFSTTDGGKALFDRLTAASGPSRSEE